MAANSVLADTLFVYTADNLPCQDGWATYSATGSYQVMHATIESGILHLIDNSTDNGSVLQYGKGWTSQAGYTYSAEFDIQVISGGDVYFHLGDGTNHISFGLFSDYIVAAKNYTEIIDTYDFDTTGNFNTYKVLLENGRAKLYINGLLAFDLVAGSGSASYIGSGIEFGLGTSEWTGEVLVNEIRAYKNLTNVPEPATMLLLGFGLLGLAGLRRKFQK